MYAILGACEMLVELPGEIRPMTDHIIHRGSDSINTKTVKFKHYTGINQQNIH